jgi:shikimate kinase
LQGPDWETTFTTLLAQRQDLYAQADVRVTVEAEASVEAIAARTLALVAERIGSDADSAVLN